MMAKAKPPAPYCQRDSAEPALRAHGCGLFALLWLREWSTSGDMHWTARKTIDTAAKRELELSEAKAFLRRGTTLDEVDRAYEARAYSRLERIAPRMKACHGGELEGLAWPALTSGSAVMVAVNYGVVQDDGTVQTASTFRGGHWVVAFDGTGEGGMRTVTIANPLRRKLDVWPWALVVKAAERFGDKPWLNGRGEFGIVAPASTFLDVCKASRAELRRTVTVLREQRDDAEAFLKACREIAGNLKARVAELDAELAGCREQGGDCGPAVDAAVRADRVHWSELMRDAPVPAP